MLTGHCSNPDISEKKTSLDRSELTDTLPSGAGLRLPTGASRPRSCSGSRAHQDPGRRWLTINSAPIADPYHGEGRKATHFCRSRTAAL
jgi:hypothetical protein